MSQSRIPSPARSHGAGTPRRAKPRGPRSVGSPARSNTSGRLTAVIQFKENNKDSFALSPAPSRRSVLNDDTYVDEPRRRSWWKKLGENSRDVMEVLNDNKILGTNEAVEEYIDIEVLSQEKKNYTIDLPDSSDSESISSIVIPQRKLFTQKDLQAQNKFGKLIGTRESLAKLHKSNVADKTLHVPPKNLFNQNNRPRSKPVFPAALLNISPNKTANKTKELATTEAKGQVRNLFGNRGGTKRKNMFADFIVSESEDEISEIQPKVFGFQKKTDQRRNSTASRGGRHSPTSSITTDIEMDEWQHLPSSTMVENQLEDMMVAARTPVKRARLSLLAEIKETEVQTAAEKGKESEEEQELKYDDEDVQSEHSEKNKEKEISSDKAPKNFKDDSRQQQAQDNIEIENENNEDLENIAEIVTEELALDVNKDKSKTKLSNISNVKNKTLNQSKVSNNRTRDISHNDSKRLDDIDVMDNRNNRSTTINTSKTIQNKIQDVSQNSRKSVHKKEVEAIHDQVDQMKIETEKDVQCTDQDEIQLKLKNIESNVKNQTSQNNRNNDIEKPKGQSLENVEEDVQNDFENHEADEDKDDEDGIKDVSEEYNTKNVSEKQLLTVHETNAQEKDKDNNTVEKKFEESINKNTSAKQLILGDIQEKEYQNENEVEIPESREEAQVESEAAQNDLEKVQERNVEIDQVENCDVDQIKSVEVDQEENEEEEDEEDEEENEEVDQDENEEDPEETEELDYEQSIEENETTHIESEVEDQHESEMEVEVENEVEDHDESEMEVQEENEVEDHDESEMEVEENEEQDKSEGEVQDENYESEQEENNAEVQNESLILEEANEDVGPNDSDSDNEAENEEENQNDSQIEDANDESNADAQDSEEEAEHESEELQYESEDAQSETEDAQNESQIDAQDESENEIEDSNDKDEAEQSDNVTHDTTGRYRKKNEPEVNSPEAILHDKTNEVESFMAQGRNTSIRKTTMLKNLNIRPSLAPPRESTGMSDGTKNSSAEGSGWDSHRTTRKTLRQTLGRDFTPRKSLRALVMEKSAKRQTAITDLTSVTSKFPQANSTELQEASMAPDFEDENVEPEPNHDVSKRTRQTTLEMYLQKIKKQNMERKLKMEEAVRNSLKAPTRDILNPFKVPSKPMFALRKANTRTQTKPKAKQTKSTLIPFEDLPQEVIEDMKYKPPKRFQPSNASWITKRLYKFLESKLESKYDYKARVRAEKLVESIYHFAKELRRHDAAPAAAVDALKQEMARLDVVKTHFDFYQFFHEYMPREIRVKVVPDVVNKISMPRHGVFSDILRGNTVQG